MNITIFHSNTTSVSTMKKRRREWHTHRCTILLTRITLVFEFSQNCAHSVASSLTFRLQETTFARQEQESLFCFYHKPSQDHVRHCHFFGRYRHDIFETKKKTTMAMRMMLMSKKKKTVPPPPPPARRPNIAERISMLQKAQSTHSGKYIPTLGVRLVLPPMIPTPIKAAPANRNLQLQTQQPPRKMSSSSALALPHKRLRLARWMFSKQQQYQQQQQQQQHQQQQYNKPVKGAIPKMILIDKRSQ